MLLRSWQESIRRRLRSKRLSSRDRARRRNAPSFGHQSAAAVEVLEDRVLLAAAGPTLIAIEPNVGDLLQDGDVRETAPRELTLHFSAGQQIDPATLGGIQIVRSGFDGSFGDANDVVVSPGFIGLGDDPNEVTLRFA